MNIRRAEILIAMIGILTISSCKQNKVEGITIPDELYNYQNYIENRKFRKNIEKTLQKDYKRLVELTNYSASGALGYDLGIVIAQIAYRMGEDEFVQMVEKANNAELKWLRVLIEIGLEYGYNNNGYNPRKIEIEFPELNRILIEKGIID